MTATTRPRFGAWLITQAHRDDPVGDLARDVAADPLRPTDGSLPALVDYISAKGSGPSEACRRAAGEWFELA